MDCKTARLVLEFSRPHLTEVDPSEADALRVHLAECSDCSLAAELERQADDRLGQAMRSVTVPVDLRERLLTRLDSERKAWYRRWSLRRVREAAVAATLLLAAWGGWAYWQATHRAVIDPADIIANAEELRGKQADDIERWFYQEYALRTVLPRNFNYGYLFDLTVVDYAHQRVAFLSFQRGDYRADVFVLTAKQFDLAACLAQPRAGSGGITVEIIPCRSDPTIAYLIKYTGPSLDWLILQGEAPVT
jgi:hypothetical protein